MPQISFIVPVYKIKEEYLRECIESIVNQTLTDIEILLIDDGSPDNCGEICDEYAHKDARVKVFHQNNQGVSAARNKGIANTTGEWITFVDADDWIEINMCESLLSELDTNDAEVDIIIFTGYKNYTHNEIEFSRNQIKNKSHAKIVFTTDAQKLSLKKQAFGCFKDVESGVPIVTLSSTCCKLYRATFLKISDLKYAIELNHAEDTLFTLQSIDSANKIIYLHKTLYHYRIRKSGKVLGFSNELDNNLYNTILAYGCYINRSTTSHDLIDGYNYKVFQSAVAVISRQYYNKQNRISHLEKWRRSRSLLKLQIYRDSLNNLKLHSWKDISKHSLLRLNLFILISLFLWLRVKFLNLNAYD